MLLRNQVLMRLLMTDSRLACGYSMTALPGGVSNSPESDHCLRDNPSAGNSLEKSWQRLKGKGRRVFPWFSSSSCKNRSQRQLGASTDKSSLRSLCTLAQAGTCQHCKGTTDGHEPVLLLLVLELTLALTLL